VSKAAPFTEGRPESERRNDTDGTPAKLYWNSTGSSLSTDFKAIGDELSNLRIVS
jgi:hypothetical protein